MTGFNITLDDIKGFYKVAENGGTLVTGVFYNPETGETRRYAMRDYDYNDGSHDNDDLYFLPIDENVRVNWLHSNGTILKGDKVQVIKGRKIPVGTVATVKDIKPYNDRFGRWLCDYLYFADGTKTNKENCILYKGV